MEFEDTETTICPKCLSDWYSPLKSCEKCGLGISEEQARFRMCPFCEEETEKRFTDFMKTFTKYERDFLNNQYDGRYF